MSNPQARVPGALGVAQVDDRDLGFFGHAIQTMRLAAVSSTGAGNFTPCGNGDSANEALIAELQHAFTTSLPRVPSFARGMILATPAAVPFLIGRAGYHAYRDIRSNFHPIDAAHLPSRVTEVFGGSIDFSRVWLGNKAGAQGRPFTATLVINFPPGTTKRINVMNMGASYDEDTLIHELTHVWQSQHHFDPTQYMRNCLSCQASAVQKNVDLVKMAPKSGVISHANYPVDYPFSAYAYEVDPKLPFSHYGGEQIAQQVMKGVGKIIRIVKAAAANTVVSDNVDSLTNMHTVANRLDAGVAI
ncbi:MAG TPA: hypothetical protein VN727_05320 [Candidatus Binatia bacterium]|nr:hypothetical protein [Candidatus Binatia bacterium]